MNYASLADRFGVDVWEAVSIANRHPRVRILDPGPGVGGHCISVDPWFLVEAAPEITPLIRTARFVNDSQPDFVVQLVKRAVGNLSGRRIAALGLTYKPDVDDLRESPAIEICGLLLTAEGACVVAYDPFKPEYQNSQIETSTSSAQAFNEAEAILLLYDIQVFTQ